MLLLTAKQLTCYWLLSCPWSKTNTKHIQKQSYKNETKTSSLEKGHFSKPSQRKVEIKIFKRTIRRKFICSPQHIYGYFIRLMQHKKQQTSSHFYKTQKLIIRRQFGLHACLLKCQLTWASTLLTDLQPVGLNVFAVDAHNWAGSQRPRCLRSQSVGRTAGKEENVDPSQVMSLQFSTIISPLHHFLISCHPIFHSLLASYDAIPPLRLEHMKN